MRSIRATLMTRLALGSALVLAGAGVMVWAVATRSMEHQFDENLAQRIQGLASILFQVKDEVEFEFSEQLMPEYGDEHQPAYFELRYPDGELLERSPSAAGIDLRPPDLVLEFGAPPVFWGAPLPDERAGRWAARRIEIHHVYPEEGPNRPNVHRLDVVVAFGTEQLVAAKWALARRCAASFLILLGFIVGMSWLAVKTGLEPARRFAGALDGLDVDDLPETLPTALSAAELPTELRPVAAKTGALMQRVRTAIQRERRTSANIAHELRTPISELLTVSEVALRSGASNGSTETLKTVRDVAWRMGRSVSTLLELARLETGVRDAERRVVDGRRLLADIERPLGSLRRERQVALDQRFDGPALVEADADVLAIIASNLLANAVTYSPFGERVTWSVEGEGRTWRLSLENRTTALECADLADLCEPFWRKDGARADRERSGLGLALSRALASAAGMDLRFELEGGIFRAVLCGSRHAGGSAA